jgi:hypothetical protein
MTSRPRFYRRDYRNMRVLARMRLDEFVRGDAQALQKLKVLPFEEVIAACFEVLDAQDPTQDA